MKIKIHFFAIVCLSFILSCKEEVKNFPFGMEKDEFCMMLGEMHTDDQKYRLALRSYDPFFKIMDSIRNANGLSKEDYGKLSKEEQLVFGKMGRKLADEKARKVTKKEKDSILKLQIAQDNINTEKLIKITQEFGWPSKNKIGCNEYFAPSMIFRHAQPQYNKRINEVIDKALRNGEMEKTEYTFILNHLNGREDYDKTKERVSKIKS